jgi:YHS domain-containing protein
MTLKRIFAVAIVAVSIVSCQNKHNEVYETSNGAIDGFDAVAYFKESQPVKGHKDISCQWNGATWHFSNENNLKAFTTNPEQYAPQFGGYCAYGVAEGHKATTQHNAWTIVNGKLYFNYNVEVRNEWLKRQDELIQRAHQNWEEVKAQD